MLTYNDLYETLRKEKYSENLQNLSGKFLKEYSEYLSDLRASSSGESDMFSDVGLKAKKQLENSIAIFRELMLRRKKKILNLVFVAAETGIMKRDYENMLVFEREVFDKLVKAFEHGDKELVKVLSGDKGKRKEANKMVLMARDVEEFVDMNGNNVGPFNSGDLVNLDLQVAEVLVSGGQGKFVDED